MQRPPVLESRWAPESVDLFRDTRLARTVWFLPFVCGFVRGFSLAVVHHDPRGESISGTRGTFRDV